MKIFKNKKIILRILIITGILSFSFYFFFKNIFFQYLFKSRASSETATLDFTSDSITFKQEETKNIGFTLTASNNNKISGVDLYFKYNLNNKDLIEFVNYSVQPENYFEEVKKEIIDSSAYGGCKLLRLVLLAKKPTAELVGSLVFSLQFKAKKIKGETSVSVMTSTGDIKNQVVGPIGSGSLEYDYRVSRDATNITVNDQSLCSQNSDCGTNAICTDQSCVCNSNYYDCDGNWSNGCESNIVCSQVTTTPTSTPIITSTPTPIETATPTTTPGSGNVSLGLKLKTQAINKKPEDSKMSFKVKLRKEGQTNLYEAVGIFDADDQGRWMGKVNYQLNDLSGDWVVYVKGQYHIQKKICDSVPTEDKPGLYRCSYGKIKLNPGENSFDFRGITLLVGDLDGNGVVDSVDFAMVKNNLGKKDAKTLEKADLNRDGIIDTQDFSLILYALSVKVDEI